MGEQATDMRHREHLLSARRWLRFILVVFVVLTVSTASAMVVDLHGRLTIYLEGLATGGGIVGFGLTFYYRSIVLDLREAIER